MTYEALRLRKEYVCVCACERERERGRERERERRGSVCFGGRENMLILIFGDNAVIHHHIHSGLW